VRARSLLRQQLASGPRSAAQTARNKNGAARSYKSLTGDFRKWCDAAGLPKHCRLRGLKKSALMALPQDRASIKEMQSISGHKSLAVLQKSEQIAADADNRSCSWRTFPAAISAWSARSSSSGPRSEHSAPARSGR
jgi:hypothetical protein